MNESDRIILGDTWLKDLMPFISEEPLSFHTAEETNRLLQERVNKIEKSLQKPAIAKLYESSTLKNREDMYFLEVIGIARALGRGDRETAAKIRDKILGMEEESS